MFAGMAELVDALDLGSSERSWGFESLYPHQTRITRTLGLTQGLFCFSVKNGSECNHSSNLSMQYQQR